jgi:hypothetical protein
MRACVCPAVMFVLLLVPQTSMATPILHDMGGFGGADTLAEMQAFFLNPNYRPSHLLARFACEDPACLLVDGIDGRLSASLFDVVANPGGTNGSFTFDGLTEWPDATTSLTWYTQYLVINRGFGSQVFAVAPDSTVFPLGKFFDGGPVEWAWTIGEPTHQLSFYGSAVRVPEPTLLWLLGSGLVAAALRRRKVSRRHSPRKTSNT